MCEVPATTSLPRWLAGTRLVFFAGVGVPGDLGSPGTERHYTVGGVWQGREVVSESSRFNADEARKIGDRLGVDWKTLDVEQFRIGLDVELEHGLQSPATNVTDDDILMTGKIAWAHLREFPDYYDRLEAMEEEAKTYWSTRKLR
jgi:hypothetical protein